MGMTELERYRPGNCVAMIKRVRPSWEQALPKRTHFNNHRTLLRMPNIFYESYLHVITFTVCSHNVRGLPKSREGLHLRPVVLSVFDKCDI